jgi:hypothetical protein
MSRAKYKRGERVTNPLQLLAGILVHDNFYWNHKCQNWAWLQNNTIRCLTAAVSRGIIYEALPIDRPEKQEDKANSGGCPDWVIEEATCGRR